MNPRTAFIAAPLLTFAYGVIRILDGLDGSRGPGLAWTTGHLAFLGAMVAFVCVFAQMRRMAGGDTVSTVAAVVGTAGALALSGQFAVDVVAGLQSADHLAMSLLIADIRSTPGVSFAVYDVGPYFFYVGSSLSWSGSPSCGGSARGRLCWSCSTSSRPSSTRTSSLSAPSCC